MTRLTKNEIIDIPEVWPEFAAELREAAQSDLISVAALAVGSQPDKIKTEASRTKVGVLSITTGEGAIEGFAEALASIAGHLGFTVIQAEKSDMAGLGELTERRANIVLCSDDHFLGAFNFHFGRVAENSYCTGLGYVEVLDKMAGGLAGRPVHLIGAGPVGRAAAEALIKKQAYLIVYDLDPFKSRALVDELGSGRTGSLSELKEAQIQGGLFVQAAPTAEALNWELLHPKSRVVHPAVPFGLPGDKKELWRGKVWHDPLQLGVAVMLAAAVSEPSAAFAG